ncbi:2-amino-4-hydroxy-6-hydroxymethyldihydropteridine diphosphokinase [Psychrobium sp. 1_MG-2023]|uniref:2-amino-4-hydroxy-6- hydroxymethyldihydropteridine diphosphokinase n=1 Tax=Psychrobium sp. 1_MG-2023 TaxID=3062624 RepID=UPI000C336075|nr:2-amino-4-hydroxy-6-hydroxymethyldihydropteridine diphosphokinase [Psychrobium sp. 1_MG-2023]MDP2560740.1 2-amino-4-hydroxy-6-hydroxymethyldihydropteridine diphosphokinase [Psychrobium sp. 1_MG-2023]PKF56633.1 2-amino-4-hydroxy-6-hydroxymethyldihydropteridine diphosphokinase [Alteromonadales bacterium alter-6D02]
MSQIYISIGSNIERTHHVRQGIAAIKAICDEFTVSAVYESESVGFDGSNFYNLVCGGITALSVEQVTSLLRQIEVDNGRDRTAKKFSSRTLDLDLLIYDDLIIDVPAQLPRDEIDKNAFVLWPLAEIAPNAVHPVLKQSYAQLWANYEKEQQSLWTIDFDWKGII